LLTTNPDEWNDAWLQYHAVGRKAVERSLRMFGFERRVQKDAKIIDVGCGSGMLLQMLHEEGYTCLKGIEPEPRLFDQNSLDVISQGNALALDGEEQYDVAIMLGVLHHLKSFDEIKLCLRNIHRVLKTGGTFYSREQWKNVVRSLAMKLVRDTPVGNLHPTLRMERTLLRIERRELDLWLELEQEVTAYAERIGLKVILHKKDIRYRYIIFQKH
jgi:2-polyprenyl-3-methyl-5-hydroxy-6-metoxy-1,4-benzoquinol methylase